MDLTIAVPCSMFIDITLKEVIMHYSIWFGKKMLEGLESIMVSTGKKRNTLVKEAVEEYIKRWNEKAWPESIMRFKGIKDFKEEDRFENFRKDLKAPKENIFEE